MIVDTHAHLYSDNASTYPRVLVPYLPAPGRGTIDDLQREVAASGVERVVAVQTYTAYRHDNSLILDTVAAHRSWMTGVLNADVFDPRVVELLERAVALGVRGNRVQGWPVDGTVVPEHRRLWQEARRLEMVICALLGPSQIASLAALLAEFPDVPVVLDHCAGLAAADLAGTDNLRLVEALAQYPNLHAKLSCVVTGSSEEFPCRDMHGVARRVIDAYGPERCMWGSDFPTSLWSPKVTYGQHLAILRDHLGLSPAEQAAILGGTALRVWFAAAAG